MLNLNMGQNGYGAPGAGFGGGQSFGMSGGFGQAGVLGQTSGFDPTGGMAQMGGMGQVGAMDPMSAMNSQMMTMFTMSMMSMMTQLLQMLSGSGLAGGGQFGGGSPSSGSPLNDFLGGGGGTATAAPAAGGGTATAAPTGSGASIGPTDGSTTPSTQNFINKALSHQGAPYVFGAQGPDKFDCSGLVYYALKEAGVSGGRQTARGYQQKYKETAITKKEDLKPGDLVFFWSKNDRGIPKGQATHIEIYLGDGKTMGTDSPKEGARVEPINWDTFIGGARVPELQK